MDIQLINGGGVGALRPTVTSAPRSPAAATPPVGPSLAATEDTYLEHRPASPLKTSAPDPDAVKVAVQRRHDGVTMITLYDVRTGSVIASLPPEAVIKAIDEALGSSHQHIHAGHPHSQNPTFVPRSSTTKEN